MPDPSLPAHMFESQLTARSGVGRHGINRTRTRAQSVQVGAVGQIEPHPIVMDIGSGRVARSVEPASASVTIPPVEIDGRIATQGRGDKKAVVLVCKQRFVGVRIVTNLRVVGKKYRTVDPSPEIVGARRQRQRVIAEYGLVAEGSLRVPTVGIDILPP